jgi:hypothetical protein
MTNSAELRMAPAEVVEATKQLDALADRVTQLMNAESLNLTVSAAGRDEVSQRVAATLNDVRAAFTTSTSEGIDEIRQAAAMLRTTTGNVVAAESDWVL